MAKTKMKKNIEPENLEFEVEDAYDVPEDSVFILNDSGEVVKLEVPDDDSDR